MKWLHEWIKAVAQISKKINGLTLENLGQEEIDPQGKQKTPRIDKALEKEKSILHCWI